MKVLDADASAIVEVVIVGRADGSYRLDVSQLVPRGTTMTESVTHPAPPAPAHLWGESVSSASLLATASIFFAVVRAVRAVVRSAAVENSNRGPRIASPSATKRRGQRTWLLAEDGSGFASPRQCFRCRHVLWG